jgi:hypothetical protein
MNTKVQMPHVILRSAFGVADKLEPLPTKKDPVVAAIAAFALGGVGLGMYLRSWVDFFVPFLMLLLIGVIAIPTGEVLTYFTPVFWAVYGYRRVKASNAKLAGARQPILEAEIISVPHATRSLQITLPTPNGRKSVTHRLQRLDDLLNKGVLTPTEYQTKRREILSDI